MVEQRNNGFLHEGDHFVGTVKWFKDAEGFGFIILDKEFKRDDGKQDLFVHYNGIVAINGERRTLAMGQRVEGYVAHNTRGLCADGVTRLIDQEEV